MSILAGLALPESFAILPAIGASAGPFKDLATLEVLMPQLRSRHNSGLTDSAPDTV